MKKFVLHSEYKPCGDQPQAIQSLADGIEAGYRTQVLLGVTGSGKTFTMANVIEKVQRPALVIAHNKTLAAQLCNEFREFFPENRVEFFVSYYDYYQPEAYIPRTDTYIEKELDINDEIDKLRHSATGALCERRDVIVVASVSCIYGLGAPTEYYKMSISLRPGMEMEREALIERLVEIQYKRSDVDFVRGTFRVRGDVVEIFPASSSETTVKVEFFGDEIDRITENELVSGKTIARLDHVAIFPATHYVVDSEIKEKALSEIRQDMVESFKNFEKDGKLIEAQRIKERVNYDTEMIREVGYCSGIENYSRYFDGRAPGQPPYTLFDFFPDDFVVFVDESHMTLPQIRAMYNGDRARKNNLVGYGFRLPSAYDNRPLTFDEFNERYNQIVCISATPAPYELGLSDNTTEQLIRPTGLVDPEIEIKPIKGQIDEIMTLSSEVTARGGRTLITTLTKKMAESLTEYLRDKGKKVKYMHSEIVTLERIEIVNGLRSGEFDILVGINLLREGLDLPEVELILILDADKEGFLRSETSLIQTIGRAARNVKGKVVMFADTVTGSMQRAIDETNRRRAVQQQYNKDNNIIPKGIVKKIQNTLEITHKEKAKTDYKDILSEIEKLKGLMKVASNSLDFERAIVIREEISALRKKLEE
ncbi:MAG: excinuclease ABC subunit UvrB [Clostridia bacterium]|nr:excinuclease ABC subunit UvrB [Clostridia bacterium]